MIRVEGFDPKLAKACVEHVFSWFDLEIPEIHIFVDDEIPSNGECYQNTLTEYMIVLRGGNPTGCMLATLVHELVHVKQFLRDDLASQLHFTIQYEDRWWEVEARELEVKLIESFADYLVDITAESV